MLQKDVSVFLIVLIMYSLNFWITLYTLYPRSDALGDLAKGPAAEQPNWAPQFSNPFSALQARFIRSTASLPSHI